MACACEREGERDEEISSNAESNKQTKSVFCLFSYRVIVAERARSLPLFNSEFHYLFSVDVLFDAHECWSFTRESR